MTNVSAKDGGNYACQAWLTYAKKQHTVLNSISVKISKYTLTHHLDCLLALRERLALGRRGSRS